MERFKIPLILLVLLAYAILSSIGESTPCTRIYNEGGAPAVFESPQCPQWVLSTKNHTKNCQAATLQGRRKYQEDRIFCDLDMRIPFFGKYGPKEVTIGMIAVFDGHGGAEASELALRLLLDYFSLHAYFIHVETHYSEIKNYMGREEHDPNQSHPSLRSINWMSSANFDESKHMDILKEALVRTIHDIDVTFTKEALKKNLKSGSTATVVLMVDGQILVANVGDSKALLCSKTFWSSEELEGAIREYKRRRRNGVDVPLQEYKNLRLAAANGLIRLSAKELTRDHHPDQEDERSRIEAAGGFVTQRASVPRVNGQLAVSRSIGDLYYKRYGVISVPEVIDWQPLTANATYLVVSSDGIYEKLTGQDVCDLLPNPHCPDCERLKLFSSCEYPLAECILKTTYEEGSMDNLSIIVVPLRSAGFPQDEKGSNDVQSLAL